MITFATFHISTSEKASKEIAKQNVFLKNQDRYIEMIAMLFQSAEIFHKDCQKVILTDFHTEFSSLNTDFKVHRVKLDPNNVMLGRMVAQLDYLKSCDSESSVVFSDSDMLINSSLDDLFYQDFDIGLTYRTDHEMPINGGIMFISSRGKERAIDFLSRTLSIYQESYESYSTWWGDQYALLEAVGQEQFSTIVSSKPAIPTKILDLEKRKVMLLPCEIYNFSPINSFESISHELVREKILHFKGGRKRLMKPYFNAYTLPKKSSALNSIYPFIKGKLNLLKQQLLNKPLAK